MKRHLIRLKILLDKKSFPKGLEFLLFSKFYTLLSILTKLAIKNYICFKHLNSKKLKRKKILLLLEYNNLINHLKSDEKYNTMLLLFPYIDKKIIRYFS
jgi:hypothetical protein